MKLFGNIKVVYVIAKGKLLIAIHIRLTMKLIKVLAKGRKFRLWWKKIKQRIIKRVYRFCSENV